MTIKMKMTATDHTRCGSVVDVQRTSRGTDDEIKDVPGSAVP